MGRLHGYGLDNPFVGWMELVIEGPAGVGKTRLAEEAAQTFTGRVIWLRAEQLDQEVPFGAVDDLILAFVGRGNLGRSTRRARC